MSFKCTIHGSYRKDLELIRQVAELFQLAGIQVLCPTSFEVTDQDNGFVVFEGDKGRPSEIEHRLLEILRRNARNPQFFAYFVNRDGYVGPSASYELSVVYELGVNFYALAQPANIPIRLDEQRVARPVDVVRKLLFHNYPA